MLLKPPDEHAIALRLREHADAQVQRWHRPSARLFAFLAAMMVATAPAAPWARFVVGDLPLSAAGPLALIWWALYLLSGRAIRRGSSTSEVTRAASWTFAMPWLLGFVLLLFGGSTRSVWWGLLLVASLLVSPVSARHARGLLIVIAAGYGVLALAFAAQGRLIEAVFAALSLLTATLGSQLASRLARQTSRAVCERDLLQSQLAATRVRNERDRVARELHDGVGADLTALILRLRALPSDERGLVARTQENMHRLRELVWHLRDAQGTLGELAKLVGARASRRAPGRVITSGAAGGETDKEISAQTAHGALVAADAVLDLDLAGVERIAFELEPDGHALHLSANLEPVAPSGEQASERVQGWRRALGASSADVRLNGLRATLGFHIQAVEPSPSRVRRLPVAG